MKKLILIIGIVLCIAVIGSVFAIAVYDAQPSTGTIGADTYVYLTLENPTGTTGCQLERGIPVIIPIVLGIEKNDDAWGTATLTVTPTAVGEGKNIDNVEITMWSNSTCTTAVEGLATDESTGAMTLTGITAGKTVYVRLVLDAAATQDQVTNTNGNLNVKLERVAA